MSDRAAVWVGWSGFPEEGGSVTGVFATEDDALAWLRAERERDIANDVAQQAFMQEQGYIFDLSAASEIQRGEGDRPAWRYDFGMDARVVAEWPIIGARA